MDLSALKTQYDVIIVGAGVAGLYAALHFEPTTKVLIVSKKEKTRSSSCLAQGGIACVLDLTYDSYDLHIEDTLIAGRKENKIEAVQELVTKGPGDVLKTIRYNVEYDRDENGELLKTLEGGHSRKRIVHHKDTTGSELVTKLILAVESLPNVTFCDMTMVTSVKKMFGGFMVELLSGSQQRYVFSTFALFATGGIGRIYKYTTNPSIATGDGIRFAYEMGASIKNLSYIQFHPTAFNSDGREQFLISEAVRGEGAYLLNVNKERFMDRYDSRLELAPRDVVSKSIILESRRTGSNNFYLDIRYKGKKFLAERFPGISEGCLKNGIDISKDLIPIFPCQHYLMGGIETDLNARTTVSQLYAAGECANTGVHGKNRLASNSLLEALVFGRKAAQDIERQRKLGIYNVRPEKVSAEHHGKAPLVSGMRTEIREIMQKAYFVIPDEGAIHEGYKRVNEILRRLKTGGFAKTSEYSEAVSIATIAFLILREVNE
ncbi:MAG TPA: FAD-binding protein [Oscillospiraceae bacterium]|nr:FAD-binding protein [Oscillospiraceae bacterium]